MNKITFKHRTQPKSTISTNGRGYIVTRPCGHTIQCHNLGTARWFVSNPTVK